MKRLIVSIMLLITLSACSVSVPNDAFEREFFRLSSSIPSTLTEDFEFDTESDNFNIVYYIDDEIVTNIIYVPRPNDYEVELAVEISNSDDIRVFTKTLVLEGNVVLYHEYLKEITFTEFFKSVQYGIPMLLQSNTTLPDRDVVGTNVNYDIDCADIIRGRIVYTYPDADELCTLEATITLNGETRTESYNLIMVSVDNLRKLPEVHINTTNDQTVERDKVFVPGTLSMYPNDNTEFDEMIDIPLQIRTRGNSTLFMPKPAFKIKFDEKQKFLSYYAEKDWVLLGNHVDQTLLRNYLAFSMAANLDMAFSPSVHFVDVYLNGEYLGNYLLTDQIEITNDRVDIDEHLPGIDTGYLIEYHVGLYNEGIDNTDDNYFIIDGIPFVIHAPDVLEPTYENAQKVYIENYFNNLLDTLEQGNDYSGLIDDSTFIDWFIINEIFKNVDVGYSSIYYYKDVNDVLKMGPVWDFDLSSGNPGYLAERGPEGWYTANENKNIFLHHLMDYPEFREKLKDRWNDVYERELRSVLPQVHQVSDAITHSAYMNFETWDVIGVDYNWYTAPELYDLKTYDEHVWHLYDYLETRLEWLNEAINDLD